MGNQRSEGEVTWGSVVSIALHICILSKHNDLYLQSFFFLITKKMRFLALGLHFANFPALWRWMTNCSVSFLRILNGLKWKKKTDVKNYRANLC